MAPAPRMTTDEYLRTPETLRPQELIYGALRCADAPSFHHQDALFAFGVALREHVRARRLGHVCLAPLDVILDRERDLIVQPDLLFISTARFHIIRGRVWGAPDLVLEVLSPHPRIGKLQERIGWFAQYGVRECWLYHQDENRLEILALSPDGVVARESFDARTSIRSVVLPAFDRTLASILED